MPRYGGYTPKKSGENEFIVKKIAIVLNFTVF